MIFLCYDGRLCKVRKPHKYVIDWNKESKSKFQFNVKRFLKKYWENDIVFEEFPIPKTRLSIDFYNSSKKIAVEVQGNQHREYVPYFHGDQHRIKFLQQLKRDDMKMKFCSSNDIILVEIYQEDILSKKLFKSFGAEL